MTWTIGLYVFYKRLMQKLSTTLKNVGYVCVRV